MIFLILFSSLNNIAQTFTELTGSDNPLNGIDVGYYSTPVFADLDHDGDADLFVGAYDGTIHFFRNVGTAVSPSFSGEITGAENPFDGVQEGSFTSICFGDIDHDGDLDSFIADSSGSFNFYRNDGDFESPIFNKITGTDNPLNSVSHFYATPRFVDLDCDGDLDFCSGNQNAKVKYYDNSGTALSPSYAQLPTSPFEDIDNNMGGNYSAVCLADLDNDGDLDAFMGNGNGSIYYGENTGDAVDPVIVLNSADNPFGSIAVGNSSFVSLYDLDNDGDLDAFIGKGGGDILTYANGTSTLPVSMVSFTAELNENRVVLNWNTATEINNYGFDIERAENNISGKNRDWEKLGFVNGSGNSNSPKSYSFIDNTFLMYNDYSYRLKQIDVNGNFKYWDIVNITLGTPEQFAVGPNYPNPFNSSTVINYQLPKEGLVTVKIYDIIGRKIETLLQKKETAGRHIVNFDASDYSSGVYLYTVSFNGFMAVGKMLYLQ